MDTQIIKDEYTYCWIECSVFGSREVIKGEQFARRMRERVNQRMSELVSRKSQLISQPQWEERRS
jgi:hypothetical protein